MELMDYIHGKTVEALLDDRQDLLDGLLKAGQIAVGSRCPEGHGEDVISNGNEDELYCETCDEVYSGCEAACEILQDLGYNVYVEGR